jgi:glycyl-tRNA synthetase beta chain
MGRYYASAKGETGTVADAIDHAYQPRFAGDAIASSKLGQVLAIAERLDTLAGGFAAGLKPTGSKDAFALRRNGLGLARTLLEGGHDLSLRELVCRAIELQPVKSSTEQGTVFAANEICDFVYDRLRNYYAEQGVSAQHFDAVVGVAHDSLPDFDQRLKAIGVFANLPEAPALAAANKRIRNILKKTDDVIPGEVDPALLSETAEHALHTAVEQAIAATDPLLAERDYVGVLSRLSRLRPQVDAFFDNVMVMADDPAVRGNRLALLKRLADRFAAVAAVEQLSAN